MCKAIDDMIDEGRQEGKILAYYEMGCTIDDIASRMKISVTEVENILKENHK